MNLPLLIQQEVDRILANLSPEKLSIEALLSQQAAYNKKAVMIQGTVASVVSLDEIKSEAVESWFSIPTTVEIAASETYFYLQNKHGEKILIKYPADLDVSNQDNVTLTGIFSAHGITVQTKGLLRSGFFSGEEEITTPWGEPFIGAILVENQSKQKLEFIRQKE